MKMPVNIIFTALLCCLLAAGIPAMAQPPAWPDPEAAQMHRNINEYLRMGNYAAAVTTARRAVVLYPTVHPFVGDLARALFLSGSYKDATAEFLKLSGRPAMDTQCIRMLAGSQAACGETRTALATLKDGIALYPAAGPLYHAYGHMQAGRDPRAALMSWIDGIEHDPGYAPNYLQAADAYANTPHSIWRILYLEAALAMPHDTASDSAAKTGLYSAYKYFFDTPAPTAQGGDNTNFESVIAGLYRQLSPVVSDGIYIDNLVMLRTRFLIAWGEQKAAYPYPLFDYLTELVKNGKFEIYNQWLFGVAENKQADSAWQEFHQGDLDRFTAWQAAHPFVPAADHLNDRNTGGMYGRHGRRKINRP